MNLLDTIKNFYSSTLPSTKSEEPAKISFEDLNHEIETLKGIEIQNFIDKIHSFIIEIKLKQLQKYLDEFKLYFRMYIKEYKIDVSKSTFLEIEENEKRKQLEETLEDTETVKIFKMIMNDYKTLLEPNSELKIDRIKYFAQFLNRDIDEYAADMYLKFINYGNKNGGWREYNYSLINLNDLL
jgi:hypothetical protein